MRTYLELLDEVLHHGLDRDDRTGVGTRGLFGRQIRFDLEQGFPLLTTKKVHLKSVIYELLWFLRGETNIEWLKDNGVRLRASVAILGKSKWRNRRPNRLG